MSEVIIVGGGLAGCEAAFQIAKRGINVRLYEMRPGVMTPAHRSGMLAELVCSSSLKSNSPGTAHGLLKEEMRALGSIVLECGSRAAVPGGDALCVDREAFAGLVTKAVESNPLIEIVREEVTEIPLQVGRGQHVPAQPVVCIIATGPLTSPALSESIQKLTGAKHLHFFDAIAPSVEAESIDQTKVFRQSRYDKGEAAYLNCPMTREEYEAFIDALLEAKIAHLHLEEEKDAKYFEGCMPVEEIARRGRDTLAYGTMKPVGLSDPRTGHRPWAVVQLRQENAEGSVYGLVGFQTQLRPSEQDRVFRMIPGLENAEFVRYGAVHRNTYIDSPNVLTAALHTKVSGFPLRSNPETPKPDVGAGLCASPSAARRPRTTDIALFFAGQLVGVEGYMESAASGIIAGINAARVAVGEEPLAPPKETIIGALLHYVANCPIADFQPMNSNFGLLPEITEKHSKNLRKELKIERARKAMGEFVRSLEGS